MSVCLLEVIYENRYRPCRSESPEIVYYFRVNQSVLKSSQKVEDTPREFPFRNVDSKTPRGFPFHNVGSKTESVMTQKFLIFL